jgi:hypothetical protein
VLRVASWLAYSLLVRYMVTMFGFDFMITLSASQLFVMLLVSFAFSFSFGAKGISNEISTRFTRALIGILFGFAWSFSNLSIGENNLMFHSMFTLASIPGVVIFMACVYGDERLRNWKTLYSILIIIAGLCLLIFSDYSLTIKGFAYALLAVCSMSIADGMIRQINLLIPNNEFSVLDIAISILPSATLTSTALAVVMEILELNYGIISNHERLLNHFTATGRGFMLPFAIFSCLLAMVANYMDLSILKSIKLYRTWYPIYIIKTVLIAITGCVLAFFQQELLSVSTKTLVQMFVGIGIALSGAILYSLINIHLSNEGKDIFDSVVDYFDRDNSEYSRGILNMQRIKALRFLIVIIVVSFMVGFLFKPNSTSKSVPMVVTHTENSGSEPVIITIVSGGIKYTQTETSLLLKSILLHQSTDLEFNFLCDEESKNYLIKTVLSQLKSLKKKVKFNFVVPNLEWIKEMAKKTGIKIRHHSGVWGISKLFLPHLFPETKRSIFIDTDMILFTDIKLAWNEFQKFTPETMIAWPVDTYSDPNNVCSCIMLWDFERSRELKWEKELAPAAFRHYLGMFNDGTYSNKWGGGDQDFLWAIARYRPELFRVLPRTWNLAHCQKYYGVSAERSNSNLFPSVVHFNCMSDQLHPNDRWSWAVEYLRKLQWAWFSRPYEDISGKNVEYRVLPMRQDYPF